MTFEEILPRLKAGRTCYRKQASQLTAAVVQSSATGDDLYVRAVTGPFASSDVIGFVAITWRCGSGHFDRPVQSLAIWRPSIEDLMASDWSDLEEVLERVDRDRAERLAQAKETTAE